MKYAKADKTMNFQPLAAMNVSLFKSCYNKLHSFKALILSNDGKLFIKGENIKIKYVFFLVMSDFWTPLCCTHY